MSPVVAAAIVILCEGLVLWAVFPIMSYYCADLGGGPTAVGVLFALLSGPRVIFNPIFGHLSERYGRRPLMIVASLGTMTASILWAVSPNVVWLAISRAIAGAFGAQAALSSAVVADVTTPERRSAGMGMIGGAFALSMVFGPLLGGWVTALASHAAVGWVGAGLQALSVLTVVSFLRETRPASRAADRPSAPHVPLKTLISAPTVLVLLIVTFASTFATSQTTTTFTMLAEKLYRFTETDSSHAFALFGLVGALVQGGAIRVLLPRFGDKKLALAGLIILALSATVVMLNPPTYLLWLSMALLGAGVALSTPTVTALLSGAVGPERQGILLGAQQGIMSLGRGCGAPVAGVLFDKFGPTTPYGLSAVIALLTAALLWPLKSRAEGSIGVPPVRTTT